MNQTVTISSTDIVELHEAWKALFARGAQLTTIEWNDHEKTFEFTSNMWLED